MYGNLDFYSKVTVPYSQVVNNIKAHVADVSETVEFNAKLLYAEPKATLNDWYKDCVIVARNGYSQLSENTTSMYNASISQFNTSMKDVTVGIDQTATSFTSFANRLYANPQIELSKLYDTFTAGGNAYLDELNKVVAAIPDLINVGLVSILSSFNKSIDWSSELLVGTGESILRFITGFYLQPAISVNVLKYDLTEFGIKILSSMLNGALKIL
ncbi:MAG: hypothetical protein V3U75_10115 [Methylococcaceae bacterium]